MNTASISEIKARPSKIIAQAQSYPVAVERRNKVQAYLIGSTLFERLMAYIENYADETVIKKTDFNKGKDFGTVAEQLGI